MVNIFGNGLIGRVDVNYISKKTWMFDEFGNKVYYFYTERSDNRNYYLKDHLGSNRMTINSLGVVTNVQYYYAYGELLRSYNNSTPNEKYKFTGKERDTETDLDYFGARYYDSELGRWLSVDPLADEYQSWSPYNYTLNNPLKYVDPNGKWVDPFSLAAEAATAVAVGVGITVAATIQATSASLNNNRNMPSQLIVELTAVAMAIDVVNDVSELFNSETKSPSSNGGDNAKTKHEPVGVSAGGHPIDKHGNRIMPSGELQVNKEKHSTRKEAKDAARNTGKGKPKKHANPKKGNQHYHPLGENGKKIPNSTHHEYPR